MAHPFDGMEKVKKACSQIHFTLGDEQYIGSGWFYAGETAEDLASGWFVTAAHCVMTIKDGVCVRLTKGLVQNPYTNQWVSVDPDSVYYDGVGDVAVIETGIDLNEYAECALRLAEDLPKAGSDCYVCGNPGGIDEDSVSKGCVRNARYVEPDGSQVTHSVLVTCPGMGGNSGGPITNGDGDVIGIYTFGSSNTECFGGGSNVETLRRILPRLMKRQNNLRKRYLGISWYIPDAFELAGYYKKGEQFKTSVKIVDVRDDSPFHDLLAEGDLLIHALTKDDELIEFGNLVDQSSPGVLIHTYKKTTIKIAFIKKNTTQMRTASVKLHVAYADVPVILDAPLMQHQLRFRPSRLIHPTNQIRRPPA